LVFQLIGFMETMDLVILIGFIETTDLVIRQGRTRRKGPDEKQVYGRPAHD
jgi:hypothetical protein